VLRLTEGREEGCCLGCRTARIASIKTRDIASIVASKRRRAVG
jgi:hypothetical protein